MELDDFIALLELKLSQLTIVESWKIERKATTVKFRVLLKKDAMLNVFYNKVLRIQSFALIIKDNRVWGFDFDNRLGWHEHPVSNPEQHIPQQEQTIDQIILRLIAVWNENFE